MKSIFIIVFIVYYLLLVHNTFFLHAINLDLALKTSLNVRQHFQLPAGRGAWRGQSHCQCPETFSALKCGQLKLNYAWLNGFCDLQLPLKKSPNIWHWRQIGAKKLKIEMYLIGATIDKLPGQ